MDDDHSIQILNAQIATAETIYKSECDKWDSLNSLLVDSLHSKKLKCQELVQLCYKLGDVSTKPNSKGAPCPGSKEDQENVKIKMLVDDQRRELGRMKNLVLLLQQDILEIKNTNLSTDEISQRQREEIASLLGEEEELEKECRVMRKELAQSRQRHWYQNSSKSKACSNAINWETEKGYPNNHLQDKPAGSNESSWCNKSTIKGRSKFHGEFLNEGLHNSNPKGQPNDFVSSRQHYQTTQPLFPAQTSNTSRYAEISPYWETLSPTPPKMKRFQFKKAPAVSHSNEGVFKKPSENISRQQQKCDDDAVKLVYNGYHEYESTDTLKDQEPHKMIDDTLDTLPDISCDSDEFSSPSKLTSTTMIDLHSPQGNDGYTAEIAASQSIDVIEIRKEANKRHFKFLTNF